MSSDIRLKGGFTAGPGPTNHQPGETFDVPWTDQAIRKVLAVQTVDDKKSLRLLSCTDFTYLENDGVSQAHGLLLDADCAPVGFMKETAAHLDELGLAYVLYTSYSHMLKSKEEKRDNKNTGVLGPFDCFRVILPLSRPIEDKQEFARLYSSVIQNDVVPESPAWDKSSGKIAQGWYEPGTEPSRLELAHFSVRGGEALDVDALLEMYVKPAKERVKAASGSADRMQILLDAFADRLEDAGFPLQTRAVGEWNRGPCPCHDRPGADDPNPSLTVITGDGTLTIKCHNDRCSTEAVLKALGASWTDLYPNVPSDINEHIQNAFHSDRTEPYAKDELAEMEPIARRWILQTTAGYHLRKPGGDYGPALPKEMAAVRVRDDLAPALSAGVELYHVDKKLLRLKPIDRLVHEYGTAPEVIKYSYIVEKSTLVRDTAVLKTGRPAEFKPEFNEQIAQWLKLFAGEQHEPLLDWLATLVELDRPTCALCIAGTAGAGKDLFIDGIAQIWGKYITTERASQKFNMAMLDSPLVVANEGLFMAKDFTSNPVDVLKRLVTDLVRSIEPKGREQITLEGASRVILTTNKHNSFKLDRQPTESDLQALNDRIMLLVPPQAARDYLISLGGIETTDGWVRGQAMARHVAWLRENREVVRGTRLIVHGRGGMTELLTLEGKSSAQVLRAILNAFIGRMKDTRVVTIHKDEIWVCRAALMERWQVFGKGDKPDDMGDVWDQIYLPQLAEKISRGGQKSWFRPVSWSLLYGTAQRDGLADEFEAALGLGTGEEPSGTGLEP